MEHVNNQISTKGASHEREGNQFKTRINGRVPEAVHRKLLPQGAGKEGPAPCPSSSSYRKGAEG